MNLEKLRHRLIGLQERMGDRQRSIQMDALKSESGRFAARAPSHLAEQASDEQELDMMASRLTASSEALAEIQEALDRLDAGKFNLCEECGGEIGLRRLEIQPWARLCVVCQRKMEEEPS